MDIACLGAVLVSRTRDVSRKAARVSVDVVDMDDLRCALLVHLRNKHDGATRLRDDNRSETP